MNALTTENFEKHFDQFLANRKTSAQTSLLRGSLTIDQELYDMQVAASTLVNDYSTIHAESDPIDRETLTRSAIVSMRSYFGDLIEFIETSKPSK